ncbi:MAG: class I SAM-dependent methyltransferase, partial [Pirellulales bacterium]
MSFYSGGADQAGTLASYPCTAAEHGYRGLAPDDVRLRPLREIFDGYLSRAPLAYALFRAAECRWLARVPLRRPVLDLGCGNGIFADVATYEPLDIGIDLAFAPLKAAAAAIVRHRALVQADACRMPLADNSVETVLAVSVCEHWAAPQRSLAEVSRVLRPGGRFIATIVLPGLRDSLLYASLLRGIGLRSLGIRYAR